MNVGNLGNLFGRALDGLQTSSRGMSVVSNNIANVNTRGYARQQMIQGTRAAFGGGGMGGGVVALGLTSLIDPYIERQLGNEYSQLGTLSGRASTLAQMETLLTDTDDSGVGHSINGFFNAWSELASDAGSGTLRQTLVERAQDLVSQFHTKYAQLQDIRKNVSSSIEARADKVNSLTGQIAQLNDALRRSTDEGAKLELKAQRHVVLHQLSQEIGINYFENSDDTVTVQVKGTGMALVSGIKSAKLSTQNDLSDGGKMQVFAELPGGSSEIEITQFVKSGYMGGQLTDRNETLNESITKLNDLAYQFTTQINQAHQTGYGLDGDDGRNFFAPLAGSGSAAKDIKIDNDILANLDAIAAAGNDPAVSGVGDNENAQKMIDLQNALTMSGGSATFSGFFSNMVSSVGITAGQVNGSFESQANLVSRLEMQRENISGVNLDEEAADLIRYQRAFEGAAKVMSVANQMLDRLMEL